MTRKILQVGSSAAVTIPTNALKALGIAVGDSVNVFLNAAKHTISIEPVNVKIESRNEKITSLTLNFVDRYREDLEALAK
jgi:antitoxin component of MazEF toxin-antitoxin module